MDQIPDPQSVDPPRGGAFLCGASGPEGVFTPEEFTPEQRLFAKTAREFVAREVLPVADQIDAKEPGLMRRLIRRAGELGLCAADMDAAYGGLALDKTTGALIFENLTGQGSFLVVFGGQVGIGSLPIVYYGTPELKRRYLPALIDGTRIGCFALTEPFAGSDAMACRTKAVLSEDGSHYVLDGVKQFITSAGIADVFIVFAKVDGEHLTGFVLDRDTPGLSLGPEEHKLGLQGTSTVQVRLDGARVPVGNLLGEVGRGHKIAFNILNIGRFKIGSSAVGTCKRVLGEALAYCLERKQFGKRLAEFGAIREKLAEMYVRTYALEAVAYRTVGMIDDLLAREKAGSGAASLASIEEYAVECALVKVLGSETLGTVADEALQCHGGYGYCEDYPVARVYRDCRVNRIFEGTNEINRLLIPTLLLRRAAERAPELRRAMDLGRRELLNPPVPAAGPATEPLGREGRLVARVGTLCLACLGEAAAHFGPGLADRQALVCRLADLVLAVYTAQSTLLRARKELGRKGADGAPLAVAAARITCEDAWARGRQLARQVFVAIRDGADLAAALGAVDRPVEGLPADTLALREEIADRFVAWERVPFEQ